MKLLTQFILCLHQKNILVAFHERHELGRNEEAFENSFSLLLLVIGKG